MPRTVKPWIGKTDDAMPPPNVTLRIWARARGRCQICDRKLMSGDKWERDHITPLEDGGANVESNFQIACAWCHGKKTSAENAERARVRSKAKASAGIKRKSRPMPGSRASGWKRRMDGTVERRDG